MGLNSIDFFEEIVSISSKHFPDIEKDSITQKTSQNHQYVSITVIVFAKNQLMLDDFYQEISQHPDVTMVL